MDAYSNNAVLDQMVDPIAHCFTPEVAKQISALRAPPAVQERVDELADKSSDGTLTAAERAEYETWVRAINFIGVLQAKARKIVASASA